MLTLYMRTGCPFCQRVMQMAENLNVSLETKDVLDNDAIAAELKEKSGGTQVPFLVDDEKGVSMPESNDIIEYLRENYANTGGESAAEKPRVHVGGSTCESCEG